MFKHTSWWNFLSFTAAGVTLLALMGCEGDTGPPGSPGTGIAPTYELIIQFDTDGNGTSDTVAAVNPIDFTITRSAPMDAGTFNLFSGSDKAYFHNQARWNNSGSFGTWGNVWAFDIDTFELLTRKETPSFQANRELTVGQGQVNTKSGSGVIPVSKELKAYAEQWASDYPFSVAELQTMAESGVAMCQVATLASTPGTTKAPADTIVYDTGYTPWGIGTAQTPDGKLAIIGVTFGDQYLMIDNDPASPTFMEPVRFVSPRLGIIKDKTNTVVGTFTSQYAGFSGSTGTAPGNLHFPVPGSPGTGPDAATGGEIDPETYDGPCDSNALRNAKGEVWMFAMARDGDTHTGIRLDTILSSSPTVVQFPIPIVSDEAIVGNVSGQQIVFPVMGTLHNRAADGEFLYTVENAGEPSESIYDVTDPANPVEVTRMVSDLATIKGDGTCTPGDSGGPMLGDAGNFVDTQVYAVNVDFTSTGGACTAVNYTYNTLAGDDLTGLSTTVTTAYLQKVTPTDPGPSFILNGFIGSAVSNEGNFASEVGTGTDRILFSDELWLFTTAGTRPFQVVDLATSAPWLITETVDFPNASAGKMAPDNRLYQVRNGNLEAIDTALTPHTRRVVPFFDPATGATWTVKNLITIRGDL